MKQITFSVLAALLISNAAMAADVAQVCERGEQAVRATLIQAGACGNGGILIEAIGIKEKLYTNVCAFVFDVGVANNIKSGKQHDFCVTAKVKKDDPVIDINTAPILVDGKREDVGGAG